MACVSFPSFSYSQWIFIESLRDLSGIWRAHKKKWSHFNALPSLCPKMCDFVIKIVAISTNHNSFWLTKIGRCSHRLGMSQNQPKTSLPSRTIDPHFYSWLLIVRFHDDKIGKRKQRFLFSLWSWQNVSVAINKSS